MKWEVGRWNWVTLIPISQQRRDLQRDSPKEVRRGRQAMSSYNGQTYLVPLSLFPIFSPTPSGIFWLFLAPLANLSPGGSEVESQIEASTALNEQGTSKKALLNMASVALPYTKRSLKFSINSPVNENFERGYKD